MHIVNVTIQGAQQPVGLFYDTAEQAKKGVVALMAPIDPHTAVEVTDAKGHSLIVLPRNVCCAVVTDMAADLKNQQAIMMAQNKAQRAFEANIAAQGGLVMPAGPVPNGRFNA